MLIQQWIAVFLMPDFYHGVKGGFTGAAALYTPYGCFAKAYSPHCGIVRGYPAGLPLRCCILQRHKDINPKYSHMKKILLFVFASVFTMAQLAAQQCNCGSIKFLIGQWKCLGKNAAGYPVYSGILNVGNGPDCIFTLKEIRQQVAGDVSLAMPLTVPPNKIVNVPITFTDNPPFIGAGNSAAFVLVFTRGDKTCKIEIMSDKLPACTDNACKCNPDAAWDPFSATLHHITSTVKCGYQFSLTCADTISLKGLYKCVGKCNAKYTAVLKNTATNAVVQTYSSFSFPWNYRFTTPGNYSLEITPLCGDNKCKPCRFFFTVGNCDTACDCNPEGWSKFELVQVTGAKTTHACGDKVAVKKGVPVTVNAKYTCKGKCDAKFVATLFNNGNNAVVQNYPAFSFPYTYTFPAAGVYRLEITPVCGNKKCKPCIIFFVVQ